ncbi:MAG: hypothetical protein H7Y89_20730 [Steroidobacteraceae bacterium]|nr:hypothetical protein [Steroidobacteraceae bacterium]
MFHPPEAVLYLQLSSRRRIVSVVLVASGFALAALLVGYAIATQKNWGFMAAVASVVGGLAAMWSYQSRVRPAQIAENRERASTLFTSFRGRQEFGPKLAVTQEGIEVGGETLAWSAIHTIDAELAEAMAKRVTLVLDASHVKRRVSFSLAGSAEQPGVIYAVIKMLWMRHARNVADFLPRLGPRRIPFARTSSMKASLWSVFGVLTIFAGIFVTLQLLERGHLALGALAAVSAVAVFILAISLSTKADRRAAARVEERIDEMVTSGPATGEFAIRRKAPWTWPILITILFSTPAAIFLVMGDVEIATTFLFVSAVFSLVAWLIAWWMGSGTIATLTTSGVVLPAGEISWRDIASIDLFIVPKVETGRITLRLTRPRAPRTLGERINSSLSRGTSDREIVVSLARSEEAPAVVLELMRDRWRRALGDGRVAAAESAQLARMMRESRTWKQFSAEEKTRSLRIGGIILAILVMSIYGVHADFRMSERWFTLSLTLSGVLTAVGAFMLIRASVFVSLRNQQGTPSYIAVFLILCVLGWMVIWSALGRALPDVHARNWGEPSSPDVRYDKRRFRSTEHCEYPLGIHLNDNPYRFCAMPGAFASLPDEGKIRVELRESWFGVHIVSVSTIEN